MQWWYAKHDGFHLILDEILSHLSITADDLDERLCGWGSHDFDFDYEDPRYVNLLNSLRATLQNGGGLTPSGLAIPDTIEEETNSGIDLELFELPEVPDQIPLADGQRVVAIGDIHGNLKQLTNCLEAAGIVASGGGTDWIAGNSVLVQVGDLLDRGSNELECMLWLCKLGRQAKEAGGALVVLWGNHEVCNVIGDYTCSKDSGMLWSKAFEKVLIERDGKDWKAPFVKAAPGNPCFGSGVKKNDPARWAAMEPCGLMAGPFLSKLKVSVKVGRTVFVHAAFTSEHVEQNGGISGMNKIALDWITNDSLSREHLDETVPSFMDLFLWMRDYSEPANREPTNKGVREKVEAALKAVDADRMVVGHTVQDKINAVLDGKVWRIDIGNGIPAQYRRSSCIENPTVLRSEALEIQQKESGTESIAVLRRIMNSYEKGDIQLLRKPIT